MNEVYQCPQGTFLSPLKEYLDAYVQYKVNVNGYKADSFLPKLRLFDKYCMNSPESSTCLGRETVMGFLMLQHGESKNNLYNRGSVLQGFLSYMSSIQNMENIYQLKTLIKRSKSYIPYIFTYNEVCKILDATEEYRRKELPASSINLPNSMQCIITMLYCTGMRISEVLNLAKEDVDIGNKIIHINLAKNDNKRIVTISNTLLEAIEKYIRCGQFCRMGSPFFFYSGSTLNDGHISIKTAYAYFRRYLEIAEIPHQGRGKGPRYIHGT